MFIVKKAAFNPKMADMSNYIYLQVIKESNGDLIKMTDLKEEATKFESEQEASKALWGFTGNLKNESFTIKEV